MDTAFLLQMKQVKFKVVVRSHGLLRVVGCGGFCSFGDFESLNRSSDTSMAAS